MGELVGFDVGDGAGEVFAEVSADEVGIERTSRAGDLLRSSADVAAALDRVEEFADAVMGRFRLLPSAPEKVELEFGLKLNAAAGVVIARTGAEAHMTLKLSWSKGSPDAGHGP